MSELEQTIRFRVLGPLRLHSGAGERAIGAVRERTVLAMLLLHPGETITVQRLVDAVWGEGPPKNARNQVQGCVSRLRRQLVYASIDRRLITMAQGYQIDVETATVDLFRFRQLRDQARIAASEGDRERASAWYRSALELWRSSALEDVESEVVRRIAVALEEERAQALEERIELDLALGGAGELVAELTALVEQHPYREALHGALMRALYRAGRQAEALAAYRHVRQALRDELGSEPGADLQQLHQAILHHDPDLKLSRSTSMASQGQLIPRELPADVAGFIGRTDALAELDKLITGDEVHRSGPIVISAIAGTAGVGKTALAIHWAHRVADRFPDGQLYVNLRGFDPIRPPMGSAEAVRGFLDALQVPPERIPLSLDAQAGLYRSLLAKRRMLVLLDNAREAAQVRPLLPPTGCLVVITSRNQLQSLVAADGARPLNLDLLSHREAWHLLARRLGAERVAAEPAASEEIIARCGRLPLALAVVAARATIRPGYTLAALATEMREAQTGLDAFSDPDPAIDLRAALNVSYATLTPEAARLFRLLGLHPGPEFDRYAVAALSATGLVDARRLSHELLNAHMLQEPVPGRYVFHDLVRAYAASTAATTDTEPERRAALTRLFDYYRYTAAVAMQVAHPYESERRPDIPPVDAPVPDLSDPSQAVTWLDRELPNLIAVGRFAAEHGWPVHIWHLSALLHRHLIRGRYLAAEGLHRQALATVRATGDRAGELAALLGLGRVYQLQGHYEEAFIHCQQALDTARSIGEVTRETEALIGLGDADRLQGRYEQARDHYGSALEIAGTHGDRTGELEARTGLGQVDWMQDKHDQALDHFRQVLEIARAIDYRTGELNALTGLGYVYQSLNRNDEAMRCLERVLEISRAVGNRAGELNALTGLAHIHRRRGELGQALDCCESALEIARAVDNRNGELHALIALGKILRRQGRHDEAVVPYRQTLDIARESSDRNWQFEALQGLGRLAQDSGRTADALANHQHALSLAADLQQPDDQARAHDGIAHAYHASGQFALAREHWQQALDILRHTGTTHTDDEEASVSAIQVRLAQVSQ